MFNISNFIPQGVEDTHCNQYEIKENLIMKIKGIYKGYGYRQILTPSLEYYDLYTGVEGTISKDEMFKLIDNSGKILVMRPDATVPIARLAAASYKNHNGYLKFCYVTNIFRINNEQNGLKREFTQAGVEFLGSHGQESDAEVIALGIETLLKCGIIDFKIDLGHAGYFKGLVKEFGISVEEEELTRKLIEEKNFAELGSTIKSMNISNSQKLTISKIPCLYGTPEKVLEDAASLTCNEDMKACLDNLIQVYEILKDYGYEKYISVDLGLVNHIHYYTGVLFKGYVSNYGRAVLSGGRYDNLTQQYGYFIPATGFGLNIDELMEVLDMNRLNEEIITCTDYLVLYSAEHRRDALSLASELRGKGFIVECDSTRDIVNQIKNAESRNVKEIVKVIDDMVSITSIGKNENIKMKPAQFLKNIEDKEVVIPIH